MREKYTITQEMIDQHLLFQSDPTKGKQLLIDGEFYGEIDLDDLTYPILRDGKYLLHGRLENVVICNINVYHGQAINLGLDRYTFTSCSFSVDAESIYAINCVFDDCSGEFTGDSREEVAFKNCKFINSVIGEEVYGKNHHHVDIVNCKIRGLEDTDIVLTKQINND